MLGLVGLLAQGARSYARNRSRLEFRRTYRDLSAIEDPPLVSTSAPVRQLLLQEIHDALDAAKPAGWTVVLDELMTVSSPAGPELLVEVELPGVMTRRGHSEGHTVPAYWLIAPVGPAITVLALKDGEYVEQARVTAEVFSATDPFEVTVPLQAR